MNFLTDHREEARASAHHSFTPHPRPRRATKRRSRRTGSPRPICSSPAPRPRRLDAPSPAAALKEEAPRARFPSTTCLPALRSPPRGIGKPLASVDVEGTKNMKILMRKTRVLTGNKLSPGKTCPHNLQDLFASSREFRHCSELIASIVPRIIYAEVPGFIKRKKRVNVRRLKIPKVYRVLTDVAIKRCRAIRSWALQLHQQGKSLNGKFKYSDLRLNSRGYVKCRLSKIQALKNASPSSCQEDMKSVKQVIMEVVGVGNLAGLPDDLRLLLQLMSQYKPGDELLIHKHPGLKKESKKLHQFSQMFAHLEMLERTNRSKYQRIIGRLPFGNKEWKVRIKSNSFLMRIFMYKGRMKSYEDGPEGAVKLYRNSIQHLTKGHSVRVIMKRKKGRRARRSTLVLFRYQEIAHILGGTLPGVIASLMKALHDEGELEAALS
ncbi:hypothetical protein EJB05_21400, partial [Eragrostis curvula]